MAAHVSPSPNHETGRASALSFRASVALFGHLGVDADPLALAPEEFAELAEWIVLYKRLRPLLHFGLHQAAPQEAGRSLHGVVAEDRRRAAFLVAQEQSADWRVSGPLRLPGLDPGATYHLTLPRPQRLPGYRPSETQRRLAGEGLAVAGALLLDAGITLPEMVPESALLLELRAEGAAG